MTTTPRQAVRVQRNARHLPRTEHNPAVLPRRRRFGYGRSHASLDRQGIVMKLEKLRRLSET